MGYDSYNDIRGERAKEVSVLLGIDEPSGIAHTGYLVEVRKASDHFRLSAHAVTYSREALIFENGTLEVIDLDSVAQESKKNYLFT